jgi:hypothetical protein
VFVFFRNVFALQLITESGTRVYDAFATSSSIVILGQVWPRIILQCSHHCTSCHAHLIKPFFAVRTCNSIITWPVTVS